MEVKKEKDQNVINAINFRKLPEARVIMLFNPHMFWWCRN